MKIKELKKTVNVAWSPAEHYPILFAAGTAALDTDSASDSGSQLEIYSLNLSDPSLDFSLKSRLQTQNRFHKLVWSGAGIVTGGCNGGLLQFYNADKLVNGSSDALIGTSEKHNGAISALDVNPYQKNLLASGASESEIFIWDLNNTSQPMAPGNKSQPLEEVRGLSWNRQVQHILASTFANRCVVWDLRKNEPIMKLGDPQSRPRYGAVSWHVSIATQLLLASDKDDSPNATVWDLRMSSSPLMQLSGHRGGVVDSFWIEPFTALTAARDGRLLSWDTTNNDTVQSYCELSSQSECISNIWLCPRDPSIVAIAAEQNLSLLPIYSGKRDATATGSNNILESFGSSVCPLPPPVSSESSPVLPNIAPGFLKRPTRAKFAFGGKLVTFERCPNEENSSKQVFISQVVSDPDIIESANELDQLLSLVDSNDPQANQQLAEYCRMKGDACEDQNERYTWFFLRANLMPNYKSEALNLLGFKQDEVPPKAKGPICPSGGDFFENNIDSITSGIAGLSRGESTETEAELSTDTSTDLSDAHTLVERKLANLDHQPSVKNVNIPNGEDSTSQICRAMILGNIEEAVELCLEAKRVTDAMVIASMGSAELVHKVHKYHLFSTANDPISLLSASLVLNNWSEFVNSVSANAWKLSLAMLLQHCEPKYCEMLGQRLSSLGSAESQSALLCHICAGSCSGVDLNTNQFTLKERAIIAVLMKKIANIKGRNQECDVRSKVLSVFAALSASQGALVQAKKLCSNDQILAQRISTAMGMSLHPHAVSQVRSRTMSTHSQGSHSHMQTHAHTHAQPQAMPPTPQVNNTSNHTAGIQTRSKYKVDPSVQSAPLYGQYNFNSSAPSSNFNQSYGYNSPNYNNPVPEQYASSTMPNPAYNNQTINPIVPPINQNPVNQPMQPTLNPVQSNPVPLNPAINGSYYNPQNVDPVQPPVKPAAPGWNDPPMVASKPKPKAEVQSQAPILHPLFGAEPPQHIPLAPEQNYNQSYGQSYNNQSYGQNYNNQSYGQSYPSQNYGPQSYNQQGYPPAQQGYAPKAESPAPVAAEPVVVHKQPIPDQHISIQTYFDQLRSDCYDRATNQQTKRKLDDVQRRLEAMYDLLREYKLSENATTALHSCVDFASTYDFESAMGVVTSLATGPDFAAVATFLPGLKVLFQLAMQSHYTR